MTQEAPIHVVAGVIRDPAGRVLVAQRQPGKHLAGFWEFPGGKSDGDENALDALRRELAEEIGITVESARPLISVPWSYPEKRILLDAWLVDAYSGIAHSREEQALRWIAIADLEQLPMPTADLPIVTSLRLSDRYLITPPLGHSQQRELLDGIERACSEGVRLIQLRQPEWHREDIERMASEANAICSHHGAELLLNEDWQAAERYGLAGVHLPARVSARLRARPIPARRWLGVSCHDRAELEHAARIGADFATLAPVSATPSHPGAETLGWAAFAELAAAAALPVYALGGLGSDDLATAWTHGAQGIAAIRALWH